MRTVLDVRRQLYELCERVGVGLSSGGAECSEALRRALLGGLFTNVAEHIGEGKYLTVSRMVTCVSVGIHATVCLCTGTCRYVWYALY